MILEWKENTAPAGFDHTTPNNISFKSRDVSQASLTLSCEKRLLSSKKCPLSIEKYYSMLSHVLFKKKSDLVGQQLCFVWVGMFLQGNDLRLSGREIRLVLGSIWFDRKLWIVHAVIMAPITTAIRVVVFFIDASLFGMSPAETA